MPSMARYDPFASPSPSSLPRPDSTKPSNMQTLFDGSEDDIVVFSSAQKIHPIGSRDMAIAPIMPQSSHRERYNKLKHVENEKNALIEDLLRQVENSQQKLEQLRLDHSLDADAELKEKYEDLDREMENMRGILDTHNYATVLIDGDNLSFTKELLAQGEQGGKEAGRLLTSTIRRYILDNLMDSAKAKIHFKLFLDCAGVAEQLVRAGVYVKSTDLSDFLRGLLDESLSFDVIDTGLKKRLTFTKMRQSYLHDFFNVHCHQILVAAVASREMNDLFAEQPDFPIHERITLLTADGLADSEVINQLLQSESVSHVLCKMHAEPKIPATKVATPDLARVESNNSSNKTINSTQNSANSTPVTKYATPAAGTPVNGTPQPSWASMAAQPFVPKPGNRSATTTPVTAKAVVAKPPPAVMRNKHGQRIDPVDNSIPFQEINRIKDMKLCNVYYLQGKSKCPGVCHHSHKYPLKNAEKNILREVARLTPCHYRSACTDPGCIYGHRCPQNEPDKLVCYYQSDCRFYGWGHGIDTEIVKTKMIK